MIDSFIDQYSFLSNFYPSMVKLDGIYYNTVEHAYQAAKTLDIGQRELIRIQPKPGIAKRLGKLVTQRPDWEEVKLSTMRDLLEQKFQDAILKKSLENTKPHELVEGNTWGDVFWGVYNGEGQNHLGKLLEEIRGKINKP